MPSVRRARLPVAAPTPSPRARVCDHSLGDHVHRGVEVQALPVGAVRSAVEHVVLARVTGRQLQRRRALRAQPAAADRRVGIALDLHDLARP